MSYTSVNPTPELNVDVESSFCSNISESADIEKDYGLEIKKEIKRVDKE